MPTTRELAEFTAAMSAKRLPPRLLDLAKRYSLDTIGVAIYGSTKPWSKIIAARGRATGASTKNGATVLGANWRATAPIAAMVNGSFAHAFELDDVHDESLLHPGTVVVPAALAVAEDVRASGTDFLVAVVAGYEVMSRVGLAVGHVHHMMKGWHPTGTNGAFGAAAAAGKLLGLNAEQMIHALGIAGSLCGGLTEFCQSGGMVKRFHAGRAAEGGVQAAYLAKAGLTGPTTVLEGKYGYLACYGEKIEPKWLTEGLGQRYMIDEITVKPYACCSDLHAAIDAILDLKEKHGLTTDNIRKLEIETTDKGAEQNVLDGTTSMMAAQYSYLFAMAAALLYDIRDPRIYNDQVIKDPRIKAFQDKVAVRAHPDFPYGAVLGSRVIVTTADGRTLTATVMGARGSIKRPATQADVEDKFRRLTQGVLPAGAVEKARAVMAGIDRLSSIQPFTRLLCTGHGKVRARTAPKRKAAKRKERAPKRRARLKRAA